MWREEQMGFYSRWILPQVIELTMRQKNFAPFRERTAGAAHGRVLEIGIGSGLNLASYHPDIETVCGVDPSAEPLAKARDRVASVGFPVPGPPATVRPASIQKLPSMTLSTQRVRRWPRFRLQCERPVCFADGVRLPRE